MKLYAIVDNNNVLEFGLSDQSFKIRRGVENTVVEYKPVVVPNHNKMLERAVEVPPTNTNDEWTQQWKLVELPKQDALKNVVEYFETSTQKYIEGYYPDIKQRSDLADLEFNVVALLGLNDTYTIDSIKKTARSKAMSYNFPNNTLSALTSELPVEEKEYWVQLIKSYVRGAWLVSCKSAHNNRVKDLTDSTVIEMKSKMGIISYPPFPKIV